MGECKIKELDVDELFQLYIYANYEKEKIDYKDFRPSIQLQERFEKSKRNFKLNFQNNPTKYKRKLYDENNDFDGCYSIGKKFEEYVANEFNKNGVPFKIYDRNLQFVGESNIRLEIKHDEKMNGNREKGYKPTRNIYLEYEAINKDGDKFIPGGITKQDNVFFWLIGTEQEYFIFYKSDLYKIYEEMVINKKYIKGCYLKETKKNNVITSRGIAISKDKCKELMIADNIQEFIWKIGKEKLIKLATL